MRATQEGTERSRGRRRALWGMSAAVVVVAAAAGLLGACEGGGHGGDYVAVGAGEGPPGAGPTGDVRLVPLDDPAGAHPPVAGGSPATGRGTPEGTGEPAAVPPSGSPARATATPPRAPGSAPARESPPASPSAAPTTAPAGPAVLTTSAPVRTPTDRRWCEDVTLTFRNLGGTAVRSGTVTFGTHVIDALGTDWSTVESTEQLPAPVPPGSGKEKTWTVCVDAWRVPLGMRVETRVVSVRWE
ncbi:hypothetical protein ACFY30_22695 [Streptomyces sp. NPDC000345]|uniref:hypothetical protein n=1 Tax=Streptomyces sp. NPDC000345 TaxID=3364537 RepID=UPI00368DD8FA